MTAPAIEGPPKGSDPVRPPLWSGPFRTLILVQFAFGSAFSSFFVLPKYLIEALGADASLVGNAHGAFAIVGVVLVPLLGGALDRYGRRPVLLWGLALGAIGFGAFGLVRDPTLILFLRVVHGLSFALAFNAGGALAADLSPPSRRAEGIGYFGTAMLSTNAFGPWLAETIAQESSWQNAFIVCGACSAVALALATRLPRGTGARGGASGSAMSSGLFAAYLGSTALGVGVGASKTFIPALLVEASVERIAPYFIAFTLGAMAQRIVFGWLPDRLGHARASGMALVLYGLSMLLVLPIPPHWVPWLSALIGVAHGMGYPAVGALAVSLGDDGARGRITAFTTGGFNLGFALSTAGLAPLEARVGYSGLVAIAGASVLIVGGLVPVLVLRHEARLRLAAPPSAAPP